MSPSTASATPPRSKRSAPGSRRISASKRSIRGADMTKPAEIADMVQTSREDFRLARHPRQQCRHSACRADRGISDREMGPDYRHQSFVGFSYHPRRGARHEVAQMGPHHQHRFGAFAGRFAVQVRLRFGQARARRPDQDGCARSRDLRHHRQLHQPRLCLDAAGREANSRYR